MKLKGLMGKPKAVASINMVQKDPQGNVVPMFNENFLGKWYLRTLRKPVKTKLEKFLLGDMKELPQKFPFGTFKSFKLIQ